MMGLLWERRSCLRSSMLYIAAWRFCRICLSAERGWPPPPMQPPGHAMTSMKSYFASPALSAVTSFLALPRPLATAMRSCSPPPAGPSATYLCSGDSLHGVTVSVASLMPSRPRTSSNTTLPIGLPSTSSTTVRSAASITPPVVPNSCAPPLPVPSGSSNSDSSSVVRSMPASASIAAISTVVTTWSTSRPSAAAVLPSGRSASLCLRTHGISEHDSTRLGSTPASCAKKFLITAPIIIWGDLHVDR
mmetsp:Transcript_41736/g.124837  ORF Transcript_41736/g.124837 Transcript_41736/m.124837 type:complete len:247 (+) Transcript_41736:580-1320(+)